MLSPLSDRLWAGTAVSDSSVTTLVTELRSALGDDARHPRFIRTAYGFGYSFCGDAEEEKSLAAGNAVLAKPADQTPLIAHRAVTVRRPV